MEQLGPLLRASLGTDNAARGAAESRLAELAKSVDVVPALLQLLQSGAGDSSERHAAAIMLRKRVAVLWPKLQAAAREALKTALLQAVAQETAAPVRRACADCVSIVARHALPAGEWPELLPTLYTFSQSPEEHHRELALTVFLSLTETVGELLRPHHRTLGTLFGSGLTDASSRVRGAALRAVAELCRWVSTDEEAATVCALVPSVLAAGVASLALPDDEDGALAVFGVLGDMLESPAKLLAGHLPAVMELCLDTAQQGGRGCRVRASALNLASWAAHFKPRQVFKARMLLPLLTAVLPLCAEEDEEAETEDEEAEAQSALHVIANQTVDALARGLPAKHVAPIVLSFAAEHLGSSQAALRRAALTSLAFAAEGCASFMRPLCSQLVPPMAAALRDAVPEVRAAAAVALAQFAEHWELDGLHEAALPPLLEQLGDADATVAERVLYAVDELMGSLEGAELEPYLPSFLTYLLRLLDSPTARPKLQEFALSVAATAAASAGRSFHPYMQELLPRLQRCMCITQNEGLRVRAHALECLGNLIAAPGGRAAFSPLLPEAMAAAAAGFELDYSELREYGHGFYAASAACVGPQLAPWLPAVVAQALASLALDDGAVDGSDDDDSESDEDEGGGERGFSVRTGIMDEKAAAVCALGMYARHCGPAFVPHLEAVLPSLLRLSRYFHEQVRQQAYEALCRCITCAVSSGAAPSPSTLDAVFAAIATGAETEEDKEACAAALEAAAVLCDSVGGAAASPHLPRLSDAALAVLLRTSTCQEQAGDGSDSEAGTEEEEDEEAAEERLMMAVSELLPALARAMGPQAFIPLFGQTHFAPLMRRGRAGAPEGERAEVSATLVEIARALGPACAPCVPVVLPFLLRELGCTSAGNRRNAVFLAGVLLSEAGSAAAACVGPILAAVSPLVGEGEPDDAVRDNAAACVARLLSCGAWASELPEQGLLAALVAALPLREDEEELHAVYACLCTLLRRGGSLVAPFLPRIFELFALLAVEACQTQPEGEEEATAARARAAALADIRGTLAGLLASGLRLEDFASPAHAAALRQLAA